MTDDDALVWVEAQFGAGAVHRLSRVADLVTAENERQNLIAASTVANIWTRHIVDSAQLVALAPEVGDWLDVGTGGGFPGLVVAAVSERHVTLCEPRAKRAVFLADAVEDLGLADRVTVAGCKVEAVNGRFAVISARAVTSPAAVIASARHCADAQTRWVLPRGRVTEQDRRDVRRLAPMFHVEQSLTDPESSIILLGGVAAR